MTKHYWRLCIRQLSLPINMYGESFPYRTGFVYQNVRERYDVGVICGKLDASDFSTPAQSVYIPLRIVSNVNWRRMPASTVNYFNYRLGPTVDYRGKNIRQYSSDIRKAVIEAMARGRDNRPDSDQALVIEMNYSLPHFPANEEIDRWVDLTRQLANRASFEGIERQDEMWDRYSKVAYPRLAALYGLGLELANSESSSISLEQKGQAIVGAGQDFVVSFATNITPEIEDTKSFTYELAASSAYFETIDGVVAVTQGILNHRFLLRARKILRGASFLRIYPAGSDPLYAPEIVLPIQIRPSLKLWRLFLGWILVFVGAALVYVGIIPDPDLQRISTTVSPAVPLNDFRFAVRFASMVVTSTGIAFALIERD